MKKFISLSFAILTSMTLLFAQETRSEITKDFTFSENSTVSEFSVYIAPNTDALLVELNSQIKMGHLKVSLLNPSGERKGGFQLKCMDGVTNSNSSSNSNSNDNEHSYSIITTNDAGAKGNMSKSISKPESGNWKIIINPDQVKGMLRLNVGQIQKDEN